MPETVITAKTMSRRSIRSGWRARRANIQSSNRPVSEERLEILIEPQTLSRVVRCGLVAGGRTATRTVSGSSTTWC